ncbi:MAG: DNA cytosine methylase [Candidatus Methanofastidiosum methylothiophilum]|uniref:DNA (cytosine-5-)-methyltransferase n=1 Tax=Candidatus Methanofastidiosum methylothiophilum TaxID=1705564 RepID=A0A150JEQ9_9EURY|nr:MAG: DNA cytosine methylase [Candidatus Methanofastidiosum methylthiophilus]KYC55717.1 MAG: DNA cytosine methylase [Candidatus Methanofastidiosum methylthiophilus]
MRVLSLFDGISCGQVAFERAGIHIDSYYASEINKYAISITQKNYPKTIQIGDVTTVNGLKDIDILIGGSPCQGFSFAGKQLNFIDPRSRLFFDYVRVLEEVKPKYFLFENVKMKKEYTDIITKHLGVEPIEINSALVSAQNRKRLYWSNIQGITQPKDKGILLQDIIHENTDYADWRELSRYIVPFDKTLQILDKEVQRGKIGYFGKDSRANRVYYIHGKAVTLCGEAGGGAAKMEQYFFGCITPDRVNKRQNGQRFNEGNKFYTLTAQDQHGVLTEGYIRKITPIECERLQTLPDNYTEGVSNTQRYKMLGNGWTVDVIAHILKMLK